MQISVKGFITSKQSELYYDCADRYAYNKAQNKFSISDGVSKSFFPKHWADILVNNWVQSKEYDEGTFISFCQNEWFNQVKEISNNPEAKWFTKNAFNRKEPGLATFVGLRFFKKKKEWFWKANALGDSFMFFVPKNYDDFDQSIKILSSKPSPITFDNFPDYLSSIGENHKGERKIMEDKLVEGSFFLMTDALAEWFLNEKEKAIEEINKWRNQEDFEDVIGNERTSNKLDNDDSAILVIEIEDDKKESLIYVSEEVADINKLVEVQQQEIESSKKNQEQEIILQKENSDSDKSKESIQQVKLVEVKLSEELETEIDKPKKRLLEKGKEWFLGKKESVQYPELEELETNEKISGPSQNQEEKKAIVQEEGNKIMLEKPENPDKNENLEKEPKTKEEPESIAKKSNKPTQNITDKF